MKKSTNTNWFTLVELIIVITILAILATIAFISFQSYTKDARDASKKSEIANVMKVIAAKEAKDSITVLDYMDVTGTGTVDNIKWGSGLVHTWTLNKTALELNSDYVYEVAMVDWIGTYTIRAEADNVEENGTYIKNGTYNARVNASATWTVATENSKKVLTLSTNLGIFKLGDIIINGTNTGEIKSISSDLTKLTLNDDTSVAWTDALFSLNGWSETDDLFTAD